MRFFYRVTSPSDFVVTRLPYGKRPKRLPVVRSPEQVALLLATPKSPVVRMVLRTIYGTGMRVSEAVHLTIDQIDSRRMVVKVEGFGGRPGNPRYSRCLNSGFVAMRASPVR